jgi:hypothetical protein
MQAFGLFPGEAVSQLTRYTAPNPAAAAGNVVAKTVAVAASSVQLPDAHAGLRTQRSIPGGLVCAALTTSAGELQAGQLVLGWTQHALCEQVLLPQSDLCPLPAGIAPEMALSIMAPGVAAVRALLDFAQVHPGQRLAIIDDWPLRAQLCVQLAHYFGIEDIQQYTTLTARAQLPAHPDAYHAIINFTTEVQVDQLALIALHPAGILASQNAFAPDFKHKLALFVHMGASSKLNLNAAAMPLWTMIEDGQLTRPQTQLYAFTTPDVQAACVCSRSAVPVPILSIKTPAVHSAVTLQN